MNSITFALCKKPVVGTAMWLSSMCVTNQALKDTFIDLSVAGGTIQKEISIPMDESYFLILFQPNLIAPHEGTQNIHAYVCGKAENENLENSPNMKYGATPKISLSVDVLTKKGDLVSHYDLEPDCPPSEHEDRSMVGLGEIKMKRGNYDIKIANTKAVQTGGNANEIELLLKGTGAGYP